MYNGRQVTQHIVGTSFAAGLLLVATQRPCMATPYSYIQGVGIPYQESAGKVQGSYWEYIFGNSLAAGPGYAFAGSAVSFYSQQV